MVAAVEKSIWDRVVDPAGGDWSAVEAGAILKLQFSKKDVDRVNQLSAMARDGTLTPDHKQELDDYLRVGHVLTLLHLKARRTLKRDGADPPSRRGRA